MASIPNIVVYCRLLYCVMSVTNTVDKQMANKLRKYTTLPTEVLVFTSIPDIICFENSTSTAFFFFNTLNFV